MKNRQNGFSFQENVFSVGLLITVILFGGEALATPIFINEIHYDNVSTDSKEAIEIAGPSGSNLGGWRIILYNGKEGKSYNDVFLTGIIPNQQSGFGTLIFFFPTNGIQNGKRDGLALVDVSDSVVQFLSYEGSLTAIGGPADGNDQHRHWGFRVIKHTHRLFSSVGRHWKYP